MTGMADHPMEPSKPSLLDPEATGGKTALDGFDFQRRYALIWLIESLADPGFAAILVEGAEDVEARFDREGGVERRAVQVKNYRVTTAKAKEIVDNFQDRLDKASPGTWTSFAIACAELDKTLGTIHNQLQNYRSKSTGEFYSETDGILVNTRDQLKHRISRAGLPDEFVMERLTFEPDLQMYSQDEWVQSRALDLLQGLYPQIDYHGAQVIYLRLCNLVSAFTGKALTRHQVEESIQGELDRYAHGERSKPSGMPFMQAPQLPSKYVERPAELKRLKEALLLAKNGDPPPPPVSRAILHGMAAVGKSVLAAAFAHDEAVQSAFPDGVLWVTLGTDPDIPQRLADWGRALGDPSVLKSPYPDAQAGTSQLRTRLQDRACLLVVDDVWEKGHIEPFLVGGSRCLLLVTSRKADVLPDATVIELDEMREEEALKLMANWAGEIPEADEATAAWLAEELGYLPLALELAGAQVKNLGSWVQYRRRWEERRLIAVKRGRRAEKKEDSLLLSLELSLKGLHEDDREPYLQLGIFAEDTPFPVSAAAVLWGWDDFEAQDTLIDLAGQALLTPRVVDGEQRYTFHDVQHEFVLERLGEVQRMQAHAALVAGYRDRCGGAWAELKLDGYIPDHLAWHMVEAGLREELYTLIDKPWMDAQFERTFSHHTFAGDVARSITAAAQEPVNWEQLVRGCLVYATLGSMATKVPPEVLGVLAQVGDADLLAQARGYAALVMTQESQCEAYRLIGEALAGQGRTGEAREVLWQAGAAAEAIGNVESRVSALGRVAEALAKAGDRGAAAQAARQALFPLEAFRDEESYAQALDEVVWALALAGDIEGLRQALTAVEAIQAEKDRARALEGVAQALAQAGDKEGLRQVLAAAEEIAEEQYRSRVLGRVAQALGQVGDKEALRQALAVAEAIRDAEHGARALGWLAHTLVDTGDQEAALGAARQSLAAAKKVGKEEARARAVGRVTQPLAQVGDADDLRRVLDAAAQFRDKWCRTRALGWMGAALAEAGDKESALPVARQALAAAKAIEPQKDRAGALQWVARLLAQVGDKEGLEQALAAVEAIGDDVDYAVTLRVTAQALAQVGDNAAAIQAARQALSTAAAVDDEDAKTDLVGEVAQVLAQVGDKEGLRQALAAMEAIEGNQSMAWTLSDVAHTLAQVGDRAALEHVLVVAEAIEDKADKVEALSGVAQALARAGDKQAAVQAARQAVATAGAFRDEPCKAEAFGTLAQVLAQAGNREAAAQAARQALVAAEAIGANESRAEALSALAQALAQAGEDEAALQAAQHALVAAEAIGGGVFGALQLSKAVLALAQVGDKAAATRAAHQALAVEKDDDMGLELDWVARALAQVGDVDGLGQALNLVEEIVDEQWKSAGLTGVTWALAQVGDVDGLRQALKLVEGIVDEQWKSAGLSGVAWALAQVGDVAGLGLAVGLAGAIGDVRFRAQALSGVALALAQAGDREAAAQAARQALAAAKEIADEEYQTRLLTQVALALDQAGDREAAVQAAEQALMVAGAIVDEEGKAWALNGVAEALFQLGDGGAAARAARRVLEAMEDGIAQEMMTRTEIQDEGDKAEILGKTLETLVQTGDKEGLQHTLAVVEAIGGAADRADALVEVARALAQVGEMATAIEIARRAVETAEALRDKQHKVRALSRVARALAQIDRPDQALPAFVKAFRCGASVGREAVFSVLEQAAPTLAGIDGAKTLARVSDRVMEVESWWGV